MLPEVPVASRQRGMSVSARGEYAQTTHERYAQAPSRAPKAAHLDEIILVTGYHRKHAIGCMRAVAMKPVARALRGRAHQYQDSLTGVSELVGHCYAFLRQGRLFRWGWVVRPHQG